MARKSRHKAHRQRDDRAFAEFDQMMKRLAKTTRRETNAAPAEVDRVDAGGTEQEQARSNAT